MFDAKIVVIGAGAAGIACATRLVESGFNNVTLLEAEKRVGGRIYTIPFAKNVVDLGAQWCHGEKGNVVFDLAKQKNLVETSGDITMAHQCIRSNGEALQYNIVKRLNDIIAKIYATGKDDLVQYKGTFGEYLREKFFAEIDLSVNKDINQILANEFFENYKKFKSSKSGLSIDIIPASVYAEYWECEGDFTLNWKNRGYEALLKLLLKIDTLHNEHGILDGKILIGMKVTHITWGPKPIPIEIRCENKDVPFYADHVVITLPLGVLKARYHSLFTPELPKGKIRAIDTLGFGNVAKVYMEFTAPFWPDGWTGFKTLWLDEDLNTIRKSDESWLEDLYGFYNVSYQPHVLVALVVGTSADKVEKLPDAVVISGCVKLLRRFMPSMTIKDPINFVVSSWRENTNFRGSFSFRTIVSAEAKSFTSELAQPLTYLTAAPRGTVTDRLVVKPVVLFAGEATSDHYFSTVHGAVETGWREADRLKGYYQFN